MLNFQLYLLAQLHTKVVSIRFAKSKYVKHKIVRGDYVSIYDDCKLHTLIIQTSSVLQTLPLHLTEGFSNLPKILEYSPAG